MKCASDGVIVWCSMVQRQCKLLTSPAVHVTFRWMQSHFGNHFPATFKIANLGTLAKLAYFDAVVRLVCFAINVIPLKYH